MKELYMDLQEQFGRDLEDLPVDFSHELYLRDVAAKIMEEKEIESLWNEAYCTK